MKVDIEFPDNLASVYCGYSKLKIRVDGILNIDGEIYRDFTESNNEVVINIVARCKDDVYFVRDPRFRIQETDQNSSTYVISFKILNQLNRMIHKSETDLKMNIILPENTQHGWYPDWSEQYIVKDHHLSFSDKHLEYYFVMSEDECRQHFDDGNVEIEVSDSKIVDVIMYNNRLKIENVNCGQEEDNIYGAVNFDKNQILVNDVKLSSSFGTPV